MSQTRGQLRQHGPCPPDLPHNSFTCPSPARALPPTQVRLSERNVVELVNKLKQRGLLGDDLLYTTDGRQYITRARLQEEVAAAPAQAGGRVPLVSRRLSPHSRHSRQFRGRAGREPERAVRCC